MSELVSNPAGAGVNAPIKLGARQKWVLELLMDRSPRLLYHDFNGPVALEDFYAGETASPVRAPYNIRRVIGALEKKGLVEVKYLPCPTHPGRKKLFVFLTPEGKKAIDALSEK